LLPMTKLPIIPVHILFDGRCIDDRILLEYVRRLPDFLKSDSESKSRVIFSLVCMGYFFSQPNLQGRQVDLRAAFNAVLSQHKEFDRNFQSTGNPEILIILGTQPADGWQVSQGEIESQIRGLILTYWLEQGILTSVRSNELNELLKKISRPDPNPRHKVVTYQTSEDLLEILDPIFKNLAERIDNRLSFVGRVGTPI